MFRGVMVKGAVTLFLQSLDQRGMSMPATVQMDAANKYCRLVLWLEEMQYPW